MSSAFLRGQGSSAAPALHGRLFWCPDQGENVQVHLALGDSEKKSNRGAGNQGINPWREFDGKFKSLPPQYFNRDNTRKSIRFAFLFISVNFALTPFQKQPSTFSHSSREGWDFPLDIAGDDLESVLNAPRKAALCGAPCLPHAHYLPQWCPVPPRYESRLTRAPQ